jgi:hypothetical protein
LVLDRTAGLQKPSTDGSLHFPPLPAPWDNLTAAHRGILDPTTNSYQCMTQHFQQGRFFSPYILHRDGTS